MLSLYRLARDYPADIIHVHYAAAVTAWALVASGRPEPVVVSVMGGDLLDAEQTPLSPLARWLTTLVLRRADLVTVKTDDMALEARDRSVEADRIQTVIWGVATDQVHRVDARGLRTALALPADVPLVLSPRALRPFYNIHLLIEAMPVILARHPTARVLLMEFGADPHYRQRLVERVAELGIDTAVIWIPACPPERMPEYYSLANVTVTLAPSDGFPQTILESLACGTPCVATRLDRYAGIVLDGEDVRLTDLTAINIGKSIADSLDDRDGARRMLSHGPAIVRQRAELRNDLDRMAALYHNLIRTGNRRRRLPLHLIIFSRLILVGLALRNSLAPERRCV